jgi:hypothetical protein
MIHTAKFQTGTVKKIIYSSIYRQRSRFLQNKTNIKAALHTNNCVHFENRNRFCLFLSKKLIALSQTGQAKVTRLGEFFKPLRGKMGNNEKEEKRFCIGITENCTMIVENSTFICG